MATYIDPGTGSMLFTILIGVTGAAVYSLRNVFIKLRFMLSGGSKGRADDARMSFAIFSDSKRYWNVFEPICDEFERRGIDVTYLTMSPDDPALTRGYEHVHAEFIGEGNRAFAKLNLIKADIVLSTTPGLDVYQWKRSKDVRWYVHIPHMANDITLYRMFGLDYYDAILTGGPMQSGEIRRLEAVRGLPAKELRITGITYMDELRRRLEEAPPLPEHERTVLLAPSWGPSSVLNRFGTRIIDALLNTGWHIVIRPHPQSFTSEKELMDELMGKYPDSDRLEWNRDNDNFEVLRRSDIMVSDFSGVIFDFALVYGKPVIYTESEFDGAPYDSCWLDEELWTFDTLSRIGRPLTEDTLPQLGRMIEECLSDRRYQDALLKAREESWADIGHAAVNAVDYLTGKLDALARTDEEAGPAAEDTEENDT